MGPTRGPPLEGAEAEAEAQMAFGVDPSAYASHRGDPPDCPVEAQLILLGEDGYPYLYAKTPDSASEGIACDRALTIPDSIEPQVLDVVSGADRGPRGGLKVPVKIDDRVVGACALFSRGPHGYSASDLAAARQLPRIRAGHQWAAEQARDAAVERQRSAEIESSVALLRTTSDVLDIRTVFPRVSRVVRKMLPHDALARPPWTVSSSIGGRVAITPPPSG